MLTTKPTSKEAALARESGDRLLEQVARNGSEIELVVDGRTQDGIKLPDSALRLLQAGLAEIGKGNAVRLVSQHAELSTQEAAEILNLSRPYVVRLLDAGKIPSHKVGTHRRVRIDDLLAYKQKSDTDRLDALKNLIEECKNSTWATDVSELPPIVVFDACVLYPAPLRDLLMWLSKNGLIAARWSELIFSEWVENLLAKRPDLKRDRLARTCSEMNRAIPDAMVTGYDSLIETVTLPDADDRHVLAVAIVANAAVILTSNLRDFPPENLPAGIVACAPDGFLCELFRQHPEAVLETLHEHRKMLTKPSKTEEEYYATLVTNGLVQFVERVKNWTQ